MSAPIANRPFQCVSMDFVGPLPTTDKNNKYILVVIDLFSRFTRLFATSDKSSETVIDCLTCVFNTFGYPVTLLSDNALEFRSECMHFLVKYIQLLRRKCFHIPRGPME